MRRIRGNNTKNKRINLDKVPEKGTFGKNILSLSNNNKSPRLEDWINTLQSRGKLSFSLTQLREDLPEYSDVAIKRALHRMTKKGNIVSISKGYYLIIPPQYASRGILPPLMFIDGLMKYLERQYYVGLLSAAALHGAAHQQPQEFYVVITPPFLQPTEKKGLKINYITKTDIPEQFLVTKKTNTGYVKVSSPELTAFDLLYHQKRVGGLNRVGTILHELKEEFKIENINRDFVHLGSVSALQRLGYLLEKDMEGKEYADKLYRECKKADLTFHRIPLNDKSEAKGFTSDNRWNLITNFELEIDE